MKGKVTYLYNNNMKRNSSSDFYEQARYIQEETFHFNHMKGTVFKN